MNWPHGRHETTVGWILVSNSHLFTTSGEYSLVELFLPGYGTTDMSLPVLLSKVCDGGVHIMYSGWVVCRPCLRLLPFPQDSLAFAAALSFLLYNVCRSRTQLSLFCRCLLNPTCSLHNTFLFVEHFIRSLHRTQYSSWLPHFYLLLLSQYSLSLPNCRQLPLPHHGALPILHLRSMAG